MDIRFTLNKKKADVLKKEVEKTNNLSYEFVDIQYTNGNITINRKIDQKHMILIEHLTVGI